MLIDTLKLKWCAEHLDKLVLRNKDLWYCGKQEYSDVAYLVYYIEELQATLAATRSLK